MIYLAVGFGVWAAIVVVVLAFNYGAHRTPTPRPPGALSGWEEHEWAEFVQTWEGPGS